jgi:hypothetical protein
MIPVAAAWVEHLIDYNWSQLRHDIDTGERAMRDPMPLVTLDSAVAEADATDDERQAARVPQLAGTIAAAVVSGAVEQDPGGRDVIRRLSAALAAPGEQQSGGDHEPSVRTVRMGDLSAGLIGKAGEAGQVLALTHDRELIGIVIPVTQDLVQFLIEQNMTRVLHSVRVGEKQFRAPGMLTTLDQASDDGQPAQTAHPGQRPGRP